MITIYINDQKILETPCFINKEVHFDLVVKDDDIEILPNKTSVQNDPAEPRTTIIADITKGQIKNG